MRIYIAIQRLCLQCLCIGVLYLPVLDISYGAESRSESASVEFTGREFEVQTLLQLSELQIQQKDYEQALLSLTRANEISSTFSENTLYKSVLNGFANVYYLTDRLSQAGRYYQQLIEFDEASGDQASLAVSLYNLAHVNGSEQDFAQAELNFKRSLQISEDLQDDSGAAFTLKAMGVNAQAQKDFSRARDYLEESFKRFQGIFDEGQMASVLRHLGDVEQSEGQLEKAIAYYQQALPILIDDVFIEALINTYRGLGLAYEKLGDYEQAFISYRAYAQLSMQEQIQKTQLTTQRLQVQFETQRFADENGRLELETQSQQRELVYRDEMLHMQFVVLLLAGSIIVLVAMLLWRSRQHGKKMLALATTDELTGLSNRRAIMQHGQQELQRSERFKRPFCCVIFDIDHFKLVNDTYGHGAGDEVLKAVSTAVQNSLRQIDALGRIGGEEFLVFATETDPEQAKALAERIRRKVESIEHAALDGRNVTISLGIAQLQGEASLEEFIKHADEALYEAKESGRNKSVFYISK